MQGSQPPSPPPPADASRNALDSVHRLLGTPTPDLRGLDGLLADLAAAFRASGAGLASLQGGGPLARHSAPGADAVQGQRPWEQDPDFLSRLRQARTALPAEGPEGNRFLVTAVSATGCDGWLLWLEAAPPRSCALAPVLAEEQARLYSGRDSGLSLHVRVPPDLPALALDAEHLRPTSSESCWTMPAMPCPPLGARQARSPSRPA